MASYYKHNAAYFKAKKAQVKPKDGYEEDPLLWGRIPPQRYGLCPSACRKCPVCLLEPAVQAIAMQKVAESFKYMWPRQCSDGCGKDVKGGGRCLACRLAANLALPCDGGCGGNRDSLHAVCLACRLAANLALPCDGGCGGNRDSLDAKCYACRLAVAANIALPCDRCKLRMRSTLTGALCDVCSAKCTCHRLAAGAEAAAAAAAARVAAATAAATVAVPPPVSAGAAAAAKPATVALSSMTAAELQRLPAGSISGLNFRQLLDLATGSRMRPKARDAFAKLHERF